MRKFVFSGRIAYSNAAEYPTLQIPLNIGCNQDVPKDAGDVRINDSMHTVYFKESFLNTKIQPFPTKNSNKMLMSCLQTYPAVSTK